MSIEYWVTCALDPWPVLADDDAFGTIVDALREDGEYTYDDCIDLSLEEGAPSFVPTGSVVLHVSGPSTADWDEVLELLDAIAAAGDGVVFSEDRQIVLDRRSLRPGVQAFKERPAWAVPLAAKLQGLHVIVEGPRACAEPGRELARVGLAALAGRVTITTRPGGFEIHAAEPTDALVAGQVLSNAVAGLAAAIGTGGEREAIPR